MTHPVVHFEIGGRDTERLEHFYADLFGWKVSPETSWGRDLDPGDTPDGTVVRTPPHVTIYVRVASIVAALDRVAELGGTCVTPPTYHRGVGTYAHVRDPEGNLVGLLRPDEPTPAEQPRATVAES
ncbi:VOC family protein [Asanoa sp. NPDC049573]|uniref:VOC family protein n=1 Tax=Asanoa sp. NPDC049573 TaxID=3155396 RepID=UPI00343C0EF6